jgi:hypothetical protein
MPLRRLIWILGTVILAAGLTIWGGMMLSSHLGMPPIGWVLAGPALLVAYIVWRIAARIGRTPPREEADV